MKKLYFIFCLTPLAVFGQAPAGYYQGLDNLTGYELKSKIHDIVSSKAISWSYDDLKSLYLQTDIDRYYENNGSLLDIYSEVPSGADAYEYNITQIISSANQEGQGWNREHAVPQSTFNSNYPMHSDLFFVIPTDARINQLRSNYPYGVVGSTVFYNFTNGSKIGNSAIPGSTYTGRVYEPIDEFKGDVARMLFYFAVRYEGKFNGFNVLNNTDPTKDRSPFTGTEEKVFEDWYMQMLLQWHQLDPVSQKEIDRNNYVYNLQKNRNPFVDYPNWVNAIWDQAVDDVSPQAPSNLSVVKTSAYFVNLQWEHSSSSDVIGYEIYQDGQLIKKTKSNQIVIDRLTPSTNYTYTVKSYDNGYLLSPLSNIVSISTLENDSYAKDLIITKYISGSGNNKAVEVINLTGHDVDLEGYRLSMQKAGSNNFYFESPLELEGTLKSGASFVAINPNSNLSCLDAFNGDFISNAPALNFEGYNYVELNFKNSTVDAIGNKGIGNQNANKSLYRLTNVTQPKTIFDEIEWVSHPNDYCLGLGVGLSTSDVVKLSNISIYPNPASDVVYFKGIKAVSKITIFDMTGKLVMAVDQFNPKDGLDVKVLPKGLYQVSVNGKIIKLIKN